MNLQSFSKLISTATLKDSEDACLRLFSVRANYSTGLYVLLPLLQQDVLFGFFFFFFNVLCNGILCVLFEENVLELKKRCLKNH